ncbi:MAG: phosphotransferase family protein [Ectothiorhodospiraceae bacterium]|nr:phosphotransferase family protein [Ectothiorhodospiraceae bacterium]
MTQSNVQLVDVLEAHRFDETRLAEYLCRELPDEFRGALSVKQFQGGQSNPTFLLESGGRRYVLRKKPPGKLLPSAHQVEREYRVIRALRDTDVPVPEALHLCEETDIIGTAFYLMRYVEGRVIDNPVEADLTPAQRRAIMDATAETMARLHRVDYRAVGLEDFGRPGNYITRQIGRWTKQYEASRTGDIPAMDKLMAWLPENLPDDDETTIAHGDFRVGNLMLHPQREEVVAVLDWELATLGHPLSDLAYCCIPYSLEADAKGMRGLRGLDLEALGMPTEDAFVARYAEAAGRAGGIEAWPYYKAFALFRLAAIVQGVYKRALDGNASSESAITMGDRAAQLAEAGWREAQKLG